jgi:hypothetical protein
VPQGLSKCRIHEAHAQTPLRNTSQATCFDRHACLHQLPEWQLTPADIPSLPSCAKLKSFTRTRFRLSSLPKNNHKTTRAQPLMLPAPSPLCPPSAGDDQPPSCTKDDSGNPPRHWCCCQSHHNRQPSGCTPQSQPPTGDSAAKEFKL